MFLLWAGLLTEVRKLGCKQLEGKLQLMRVVWLPPPLPTDTGALPYVCGTSALTLLCSQWFLGSYGNGSSGDAQNPEQVLRDGG